MNKNKEYKTGIHYNRVLAEYYMRRSELGRNNYKRIGDEVQIYLEQPKIRKQKLDETIYVSYMGAEYGDLWKLYAALYPKQWKKEFKNLMDEIDYRKTITDKRGGNRYANTRI